MTQKRNRQWVDRTDNGTPRGFGYDHHGMGQNGVAPTVVTPPGGMPRYTMTTTPGSSYQIQSPQTWMTHPQYIMQPQLAAHAQVVPSSMHPGGMDPSVMPQLASQMAGLQLSGTSVGDDHPTL